jgi:hypothetical protein
VLTEILAAHVNDAAGKQERTWNERIWKMQSTMMTFVRQRGCAPKTFDGTACAVIIIGLAGFAMTALPIAAGTRLLLVRHRSEPDGGILGRLSAIAHVWSRP